MPVAISFPDPVNSAAQFIDRAVKGDAAPGVASGAVSQAADGNFSAASSVPKDRRSPDEDFNAVLALLLNGGVPLLQPPVVPLKIEEKTAVSGTADTPSAFSGIPSSEAGNSHLVTFGHLMFKGRELDPQQTTATPGMLEMPKTPLESVATKSAISESAGTVELGLANTEAATMAMPASVAAPAIDAATVHSIDGSTLVDAATVHSIDGSTLVDKATMATTETQRGGASTQVSGDAKTLTTQVLAIPGAATPTAIVNVAVLAPSVASVSAKPLTREMIQALERIGRPLETGVVPAQKAPTAAMESKSQQSALPDSALPVVVDPLALKSMPSLTPSLAAQAAKVSTAPSEVPVATALIEAPQPNQPPSPQSNSKVPFSSFKNESPSAETLLLSPSLNSAEAGKTKSIEFSQSAFNSTDSTFDLKSTASKELHPLVESAKRPVLADNHELASNRSIPQISSASDLTAATAQSGLISSAVTHSVPDLAASISAEMRQPLTSQVSQAIMDHVERNGVRQNDSLSVRLDPPELGEMTIQLSKTHEGLVVRITAREAVTMDMLFARGQEIESQLRGQHMNLKSLEFQRGDISNSGFSQGQSQQQNNSSERSENLLNQIRGGTRGVSSVSNSHPRSVTSDSNYGLSFRA